MFNCFLFDIWLVPKPSWQRCFFSHENVQILKTTQIIFQEPTQGQSELKKPQTVLFWRRLDSKLLLKDFLENCTIANRITIQSVIMSCQPNKTVCQRKTWNKETLKYFSFRYNTISIFHKGQEVRKFLDGQLQKLCLE